MKKLICLLTIAFLCMGSLFGCNNVSYNAQLIDKAMYYMRLKYLDDNIINACDTEWICYPEMIIDVIQTQEEFQYAFVDFPQAVNFDKEMLVIIVYYGQPQYNSLGEKHMSQKLKRVEVRGKELNIHVQEKNLHKLPNGAPSGYIAPQRGFIVIKMDKVDIENVNFDMNEDNNLY